MLCNKGHPYLTSPFTSRLIENKLNINPVVPGNVAQSVTCLATDASLTADPGVASLIPARSHTFVVIDHEIISMVILPPSAESFKKGCCQLQAKERGSIFMFVQSGCISTDIEFMVP